MPVAFIIINLLCKILLFNTVLASVLSSLTSMCIVVLCLHALAVLFYKLRRICLVDFAEAFIFMPYWSTNRRLLLVHTSSQSNVSRRKFMAPFQSQVLSYKVLLKRCFYVLFGGGYAVQRLLLLFSELCLLHLIRRHGSWLISVWPKYGKGC